MKRTEIRNLNNEIPVEIRLEVYKEALEDMTHIWNYGLCIGLPMILWGLKRYTEPQPDGKLWNFGKTGYAFPELNLEVINHLSKIKTKTDVGNQARTEVIKKFIEKLS